MSSTNSDGVSQFLHNIKDGSILMKRKRDGTKHSRRFFLHPHERFVSYDSEKTFTQPYRYYIEQLDEIRPGLNSRTFDRLFRHKMVEKTDDERAFSLFYNNYRDELHLMADDKLGREMWVKSLEYLMDSHAQKHQRHVISETNWILNYFYLADKDGSNTLTKKECRELLTDILNAKVSQDVFEALFKEADTSGEGLLTSDEFVKFFHLLNRRQDLYQIMQRYVKDGENQPIDTISMTVDELLYFLQNAQNQTIIKEPLKQSKLNFSLQSIDSREQVQELISEFETDDKFRQKGQLSVNGLRNLLLSNDFSLMKPWCARYVYQDMTRPLNNYYIKTSHNTYLFNNQLVGDSNPEAYNRALRAGCRAVELDCYDGDNGRPIVKHGFTLVKPCLFESIIRFIEPNLFKTSPYPVILDIENHCSIEQQFQIVRILQKILGDRLIAEPLTSDYSSALPSPEDLKYKVLLRGVKLPKMTIASKLVSVMSLDDDKSNSNSASKAIQRSLSDVCIYFQNVPYREYEYAKDNYLCYHSANVAEKLFQRAAQENPVGIIKQTKKSVLRMYPDGLRQDSSNPDPITPWNFGMQMVALNYQNNDPIMSLAYGKFLDNGGCGYVLKPVYLTNTTEDEFNPFEYLKKPYGIAEGIPERPQRLTITIISGQLLPRSNQTTNDIPDPYVVVSTHGIPCDQQSQKTKFIENNGFDPTWNETFTFDIYFPQMCLLRFDVYDYDRFSRDDRLACFCLPVTTMQTGYRHVLLRAPNNNLTCSTLFVHVDFNSI